MRENKIVISEVMMPSQANPNGNVHGGEIMKMAGFLAALGMKPVKNTALTVERDDFMAMKRFACNWLMADISADEESKRG